MSDIAAPTFEQSAIIVSWAAILLLSFAMSGLLRQVHALTRAVRGSNRLTAGPVAGMVVPTIPELVDRRPAALLFVDPGCASCQDAIATFASAAEADPDSRPYALVYRAPVPTEPDQPGVTTVTNASDLFNSLNISVTPTLVLVDERRRVVASAPVGAAGALAELLPFATPKRRSNERADQNPAAHQ